MGDRARLRLRPIFFLASVPGSRCDESGVAMTIPPQTSAARPTSLLLVALVVAGLYLARDFLLPLALAVLISFLLAPLIQRFEHWGMGRIVSVIAATGLAFSLIGAVGYLVAGQLIDLASQVEGYKTNLGAKIATLKTKPGSPFDRVTRTLRDLNKEFTAAPNATPAPNAAPVPSPVPAVVVPPVPVPVVEAPPVPVAVVETPGSALVLLRDFISPVLAPLGTAAIVIVFVIFILIEREDLRDRVIHLIGRGRLHVTTQVLDEAAQRVSRYLVAQLIVNVTYGIPIGVGLWLIGIPNAFLWGFLATLLRFVPFIGPWIAAFFPVALSLAVSPSWSMPLLALGLFVIVELISNNVVEPWLYGSSTGLSPMAIIVAAVFWTWLWGAPGLILATPLTVCIAVLGKYVPSLSYLDVLLGDKPPIAMEDRFYQRLLALDEEEALELVETHVSEHDLTAAFDEMVLPALRQCETDFRSGDLSEAAHHDIHTVVRDLLDELRNAPLPPVEESRVLCLSARDEADELAALMLAHLLAEANVKACVLSSKLMTGELIEKATAAAPALICISALPPGSTSTAAHLCKRIRERMADGAITVGLWGHRLEDEPRRIDRLKRAQADHVFTTFKEAVAEIRAQPALATAAADAEEKAA